LTDGIVPAPLFARLEQDIAARGPKQLTDDDEIKTWVLDVLSSSPNHNISFVFLTSMLSRVASEFVPVPKSSWRDSGSISKGRASMDSVRRSLSWKSKAPPMPNEKQTEKRRTKERAFVEVFKDAVIRGPGPERSAKERKIAEERKREVLEAVLRSS
jgi:phosphatidylinositol-bisphosphatase